MNDKRIAGILAAALLLGTAAGCKNAVSPKPERSNQAATGSHADASDGARTIKALHFVSGKLGDKGFFDSAERGLQKASFVYGFDTETVEGGLDGDKWEPQLDKLVAAGTYDVIVVGTSTSHELVLKLAKQYPRQKFVFYDDSIQGVPNVYAMLYSQSEGSFLAGAFAAMATTDAGLKGANPEKVVGFIGGLDMDVIRDFESGYKQGARYIDPEIRVVSAYVGDFVNQAKARALAKRQYESQKVDIIYNAAGGAGLGLLKEGNGLGKYSIGVDSDQNPLFPGSVLVSVLKNVDESVFRALSEFRGGTLPFGTTEVLGVKDGGVGLARDELYEQYVPSEIKEKMKDIESKIASGEIKVESSLAAASSK
ncbi:BMP family protein [Cohnella sp. GCM10020058]|uniref:BMP family lipoprotein n=1 Tax=Cohnella sp. GCM10020058 TaxID=3317330 RepID=UPI0036353CC5